MSNLLDERLRRPRAERHTECGHGRTHRPAELDDVSDGLLSDGIRLAPGSAGLTQGSRILLASYSGLLQLGLDLWGASKSKESRRARGEEKEKEDDSEVRCVL
jgi:hypothetical protein